MAKPPKPPKDKPDDGEGNTLNELRRLVEEVDAPPAHLKDRVLWEAELSGQLPDPPTSGDDPQ